MKIVIEAEAKEIAALVLELQERQCMKVPVAVSGIAVTRSVLGAIRDMPEDTGLKESQQPEEHHSRNSP